ncbi:MAG: hypothetical protein V3W01_00385 [Dehalococcoidales bacterium]
MPTVIDGDQDALLDILPPHIREPLCQQDDITTAMSFLNIMSTNGAA